MVVERCIYKSISFVLLIGLSLFSTQANASIENKNDSVSTEQLNQLREQYSVNKKIPTEFEKEILIALSHYPELKTSRIKFCYSHIFTSMKAVPTLGFLFQKPENRTYRIVMNSKKCHGRNMMQRSTSTALIGVIGHELGHIKDYSQRSNSGLFKLLFNYIFKKSRIETEKRADNIAVDHNLGKELLEFTTFIYQDTCMNPKYIEYKKKYYSSVSNLDEVVKCHKSTSL